MSREIHARLVNGVKWVAERPDTVILTLAVRTEDLGFCATPLPKDLTLVVPEPIPAPDNPNTMTLELTTEMLENFPEEIRWTLQRLYRQQRVD